MGFSYLSWMPLVPAPPHPLHPPILKAIAVGKQLHTWAPGRVRDLTAHSQWHSVTKDQWGRGACGYISFSSIPWQTAMRCFLVSCLEGPGWTDPQLPTVVTCWLSLILFYSFHSLFPFPGSTSPSTLSAHKLLSAYELWSQALFSGTILAKVSPQINAIRLY